MYEQSLPKLVGSVMATGPHSRAGCRSRDVQPSICTMYLDMYEQSLARLLRSVMATGPHSRLDAEVASGVHTIEKTLMNVSNNQTRRLMATVLKKRQSDQPTWVPILLSTTHTSPFLLCFVTTSMV